MEANNYFEFHITQITDGDTLKRAVSLISHIKIKFLSRTTVRTRKFCLHKYKQGSYKHGS